MSEIEVSFERDILPLFRVEDRDEMEAWFDLFSVADVREHADAILERLEDGSMPCDAPWSPEHVARFGTWIRAGTPA